MSWREVLTEQEQHVVDGWLGRVLHDLVKYLEMMPRSLDWDDLSADDLECLWESIFETRSFRGKVQTAAEIWEGALNTLPEQLKKKIPGLSEVSESVKGLMDLGSKLEEGDVDQKLLHSFIFDVGTRLRALRDE